VAKTSCANGKTVKREGKMPNASMAGKVSRIYNVNGGKGAIKNARAIAKVKAITGGVVHATSMNYGSHHSKAQQTKLTGQGGYAAGDKD